MRILLLAAIVLMLLLFLGPLRRRFFLPFLAAWWRSTVPLIAGGIAGVLVVNKLMPGAPGWMKIVGPVMAAFMIGGAIEALFHNLLAHIWAE